MAQYDLPLGLLSTTVHMSMQRNATRTEILAIIETYEGIIRKDFSNLQARNARTHWVCELLELDRAGA